MRHGTWLLAILAVFCWMNAAHADEKPVAKVNGVVITTKDLEAAIDRIIPRATYHGNVTQQKRDEFRDQALEELIAQELQFQDGTARNIVPDRKAGKMEMEKIRERFKSERDYKKALEQADITESQLRVQIDRQLVIQAVVMKTVVEPSKVKEEDIKDYYTKNTAKFVQPESVSLRIITSNSQDKAEEALKKIKQGDDFGTTAARYSEDNFRVKGGDIGFVHRGRILPELEEAAFKMKKGETSGIVKAEGKWFIVKVEDRKPEYHMAYDEVKARLKKDLEEKRSQELMDQWMSKLRAKAKIEIPGQPADAEQQKR